MNIKIYIKKPNPYIALRGRKPFQACFLWAQILIVLSLNSVQTFLVVLGLGSCGFVPVSIKCMHVGL